MIAADSLVDGHPFLSDWLLLIAGIVFVLAALVAAGAIPVTTRDDSTATRRAAPVWLGHGFLIAVGLALLAIAFFVL